MKRGGITGAKRSCAHWRLLPRPTLDGIRCARTLPLRKARGLSIALCLSVVALWYFSDVDLSVSGRDEALPGVLTSPSTHHPVVFTPVTFDKTRHAVTQEVGACNNLALAPANVKCTADLRCGKEQLYTIFIRCNHVPRRRWGEMNLVGFANFSMLNFDEDPYAASRLQPPRVKPPTVLPFMSRARSYYDSLLDDVAETHRVYENVLDRTMWPVHLRLLKDTRDTRIFHFGSETCVTTLREKDQIFVVCYDFLYEHMKVTGTANSRELSNPPSRTIRVKRGRNAVPLVHKNHQAWTRNDATVWLFDPMGSNQGTPVLFPVSLHIQEDPAPEMSAGVELELQRCEDHQAWRGNTPVIKLTDTTWITVVHKRIDHLFPTPKNLLRRSYDNEILLLEADERGGLPVRCSSKKYERRIRSAAPFVFLLGLVHVGVQKNDSGEYHTFITTGSIDDFMPVLHTFEFFLPR